MPLDSPPEHTDTDNWAFVQSRVVEDWGADSLQFKLLAAIVDEFTKTRRRFRLSEFPELVGRRALDREVEDAAMCLTSQRARLLQLAFELQEQGDESYPISPAAVVRAIRENVLEHPVTNEVVEDFREKIVMYLEDRRL